MHELRSPIRATSKIILLNFTAYFYCFLSIRPNQLQHLQLSTKSMQVGWSLVFKVFRSWTYLLIVLWTMVFFLLPCSILLYLEFQSSIIPTPPPLLNLQFQYIEYSGPYAFFNMTETADSQAKPWRDAKTNMFTTVEQVLTLHMKYTKLSPGSTIGGVRVSVYEDHHSPVLIQRVGSNDEKLTHKWPFRSISLNSQQNEYSLYRVDRRFRGWKDIVGKAYSKSIPFVQSNEGVRFSVMESGLGLMDFFCPKWLLNIFVPMAVQELFSFENVKMLMKRNENYKMNDVQNNKHLETISLLESFGDFSNMKTASFSTGFVLFEGLLDSEDFRNTSVLVEMDLDDIFVIEAYLKIDYVLRGIRWWVYWWPGLCFFIGTTFIWLLSCVSCFVVAYFGTYIFYAFTWLFGLQKSRQSSRREVLKIKG